MFQKILKKLFGSTKRENKAKDYEWERFQVNAKDQFRRLKEKGLSIPVVTL